MTGAVSTLDRCRGDDYKQAFDSVLLVSARLPTLRERESPPSPRALIQTTAIQAGAFPDAVFPGEGSVKRSRMGREPREGDSKVNNSKLFVGGLAWATTDETLQRAFSSHGEVTESRVVMDRTTGRSRGFGFVTFAAADSAKKARDAMDNAVLDGRNIRVDFATERERN